MKKMSKRILPLLLVFAMIFSCVPANVAAAEGSGPEFTVILDVVDQTRTQVNGSLKVDVQVSATSESAFSAAEIYVKYDNSLVSYSSCAAIEALTKSAITATTESSITSSTEGAVRVNMYGGSVAAGMTPVTIAELTFVPKATGTAVFTLGDDTILAQKDSGSSSIKPTLSDEGNSVTILPAGYHIALAATEHGTVSAIEYSTANNYIYPEITPDAGYGVASVSVITVSGTGISYGPYNGKDCFNMPASDVTVTVVFSQLVSVTVPGTITGGSISGAATQAAIGTTYTLTVSKQTGYDLSDDGLSYTTSESAASVPITARDDNHPELYYFTVPNATAVAIHGEFAALPLLDVNIADVENGTITVSPASVYPGDTATVTITPVSGYSQKAKSVKYITASGNEKLATQKNASSYTFTMPKETVTVSAVFLSKTRSIGTPEEYGGLADDVKEARGGSDWNITLSADINLSGTSWTPIGQSYPFNGTFDGAGHTVTLKADETAGEYCALIGKAGNVTVSNITVNGKIYNPYYYYSAGIVASVTGKLTAVNCVNNADITGFGAVGGIAGSCSVNASFTNCSNTGTIIGTPNVTGAIAGNGSAAFTNCTNAGIVFCSTCQAGALLGTGTVTDGGGNSNTGSIVKYDTGTGKETISVGEANAVPDENGDVSVNLSAGLGIKTADITVPNDLLKNLSESLTVESLTMKTDAGTICFNKIALGEVLTAAGTNDAVITLSRLTSSTNTKAQELINAGTPVFSVGISANNTAVLTGSAVTGSAITVSLPYTKTGTGKVTVKKIADDGTQTSMETTYSDGLAIFDADQMSLYSVKFTAESTTGSGIVVTKGDVTAPVWDGYSIDVSWFNKDKYDSTKSFYISTPAQLAGLAAIVNGIYNTEIDAFAGDTSCIVANWSEQDGSGPNGQNMSTSRYCMGSYDFNGKTVYLTADIDMSGGNYMPIGGQYLMKLNDSTTKLSSSFCGTLDGQGHSVTIECNRRCSNGNFGDGASVGLIGRLGVHDDDPVGLRPKNPAVRNVAVYGEVYANRSVGGIVGKIGKTASGSTGGIIENCANFAFIHNTDAKGVGGIVGAGWNGGIIRNCYNAGKVLSTYTCPAGGISGSNEIPIQNCYSIGKISAQKDSYAMAIGTNNAGAPYSVIKNCWYLDGTAPGGGYYTGGAPVNDGALTLTTMKTINFLNTLGPAFAQDKYNINHGYPVLAWQAPDAITGTGDGSLTTTDGAIEATATITVQAVMNGTTAKAAVTEAQMTQVINEAVEAAKDAKPGIEIVIEASDSATAVETVIPGTSLQSAVTNGIQMMKVNTPVGSITLDGTALESMAKQAAAGSDATISIKKVDTSTLTEKQKSLVGDAPVYGASVISSGKNITDYGSGVITISIPYVMPSNDQDKTVHVYYLNSKGKLILMSGSYDSSTGMMAFTTTHLSMYMLKAEKPWNNPFTDVSAKDWFSSSVEHVSLTGLFSGTGQTTFSPNVSMTRAMLVTALWRMEGEPSAASAGFADVADGKWYTDAVNWAAENGIVSGYDATSFGPNDSVTRQQLAAILYRFAKADGYDVSKTTSLSAYTDKDSIANWAQTELTWANAAGLITGRTTATLLPDGSATRAEVAAILMRYQHIEI